MPESIDWNYVFMIRLALAGILGAAIGFERECRAKEAGTRTHFLVAIGSCLMMIVSQWGFGDHFGSADPTGVIRYDVSRVAAQIVSGIGFIGAGTIMMQKQVVHGADHRRGYPLSTAISILKSVVSVALLFVTNTRIVWNKHRN